MSDAGKIYYPKVIQETPFPGDRPTDLFYDNEPKKRTKDEQEVFIQKEIKELGFPKRVVAVETIGSSLNTRARKILGEFQFTQQGALQIGKYEQGISGDIRWSPTGMIARNAQGETTIGIDADTGDVTIKGRMQSGSLISGNITVGGRDNGEGYISVLDSDNLERVYLDKAGIKVFNGRIIIENDSNVTSIDAKGLVSTANFVQTDTSVGGTSDVTSTSFVDIPGATVSFTTTRERVISIYQAVITFMVENPPTDAGIGVIVMDLDGVEYAPIYLYAGADFGLTFFNQRTLTLAAGSHVLKLKAKIYFVYAGTPAIRPLATRVSYVLFGN